MRTPDKGSQTYSERVLLQDRMENQLRTHGIQRVLGAIVGAIESYLIEHDDEHAVVVQERLAALLGAVHEPDFAPAARKAHTFLNKPEKQISGGLSIRG